MQTENNVQTTEAIFVQPVKPEEAVQNHGSNASDGDKLPNRIDLSNRQNTAIGDLFKRKLVQKLALAAENDVKFRCKYFWAAFTIHFVYYLLLGPLTPLLLGPVFGWRMFMNMQFYSGGNAWFQNVLWLFNGSISILLCLYPSSEIMDLAFVLLFNTLLRIAVISIRYGYTSRFMYELISHTNLTSRPEFSNDLVLVGYRHLTPEEADREVRAAMWRCGISTEEFHFLFVGKMPQVLFNRLSKEDYYATNGYSLEEDIKIARHFEQTRSATTPRPQQLKVESEDRDLESKVAMTRCEDHLVPGCRLARELALRAKVDSCLPYFPAIVGICHGLLPFIGGAYEDCLNTHWSIIVARTIHLFDSGMLLLANILIISMGIVDFQRRLRLMNYLNDIIWPDKAYGHYFPRIDRGLPSNLLSWDMLRLVMLEFGKKFRMRLSQYNSMFLGLFALFFSFILLYYFEVVQVQLSFTFLLMSWYDLALYLGILYYVCYLGIKTNEQFAVQQDLMHRHKKYIHRLQLVVKYHNGEQANAYQYKHDKTAVQYVDIHRTVEGVDRLEDVLTTIDLIQEQLEIDKNIRPTRILGFVPTYEILQGSLVFVASMILAVLNQVYDIL